MLKELFNSMTPDNIKDIPLMIDAMDIFISEIEEKGAVAQDIIEIFKEDNNSIAREEFIKIYLDDLYRYLTKAKIDKDILNEIDKENATNDFQIDRDFIGDMTELFNNEHFVTSKQWKQKKGTVEGIEYMYNFVESLLESGLIDKGNFEFIPGEPFQFQVEGGLYKSFYDKIVKPLAHPLGFTYTYLQILKIILEDNYSTDYSFSNFKVEVRCLSGEIDVYSPQNPLVATEDDNTVLTENNNDLVYGGIDVVKGFDRYVTPTGTVTTVVIFIDNTYLVQTLDPIHVIYYAADGSILKDYTGHCSLYLDYETTENLLVKDELEIIPEHYLWDSWCLERDTISPFTPPKVTYLRDESGTIIYNEEESPIVINPYEDGCADGWDYIIGDFTVGTPPDFDTGYIGSNSQHLVEDHIEFVIEYDTRVNWSYPTKPGFTIGNTVTLGDSILIGQEPSEYEDGFATDIYITTVEVGEDFSIEVIRPLVYDENNIATEFINVD